MTTALAASRAAPSNGRVRAARPTAAPGPSTWRTTARFGDEVWPLADRRAAAAALNAWCSTSTPSPPGTGWSAKEVCYAMLSGPLPPAENAG